MTTIENSPRYRQFATDSTLKDKRTAIRTYLHRERQASHRFQLENGEVCDGFILELAKESLFFSPAYDPLRPEADLSPFDIPIARITALID